mmetsp:Transcript_6767/g.14911  ORF Transcript_6767/g.14911 Transcript_6767/m.14911 type:complete len:217 (+) Transcript_6767:378-1028(+)
MLSVILHKHFLLLLIHHLQSLAHQPRTLGIFNIRSNLAKHLRRSKRIQHIILNLKVLPETHAHIFGIGIEFFPLSTLRIISTIRQRQGTREVERIITRLVTNTSLIPIQCKPRQIQFSPLSIRVGSAIRINMLSNLRLIRRVNEQLQYLHIGRMPLKMPPQRLINHILQNKSIVNSIVLSHIRLFIPTRIPTTSDAPIHDVVRHQKERLKPFHLPS